MLSPKQIGTICFAFLSIFLSQKSFSENIPSENPTCDNSTLGVYSGSVALEPDWGANKIKLRWYNNNTLMAVSTSESSCDYDSSIDVPDSPSRTGYNFSGWTVRPQRDFRTLNTSQAGTKIWGKGETKTHADNCYYKEYNGDDEPPVAVSCKSDPNFFELQQHEWKVEFKQGDLYGMTHCSAKSGDLHGASWSTDYKSDWSATTAELDAVQGEKRYCWCKATGFVPVNSDTMYGPSVAHSWVYEFDYGNTLNCSNACAQHCAWRSRRSGSFNNALFSPATNNQ